MVGPVVMSIRKWAWGDGTRAESDQLKGSFGTILAQYVAETNIFFSFRKFFAEPSPEQAADRRAEMLGGSFLYRPGSKWGHFALLENELNDFLV